MFAIPLGALNAILNFIVWFLTGFCFSIAESIYQRLSFLRMQRTGRTAETDASEVIPQAWLFGHIWSRRKVSPSIWVIIILTFNFSLFPLEILLEAGAYERHDCSTKTANSTGVCASKWGGHSYFGVSAVALSTIRTDWVDADWDAVLVGSKKLPDPSEVRSMRKLRGGARRSYLIRDCKVDVSSCVNANCGSLTAEKVFNLFDDIVTDWSQRPRNASSNGDIVAFNHSLGIGFLFWDGGTEEDPLRAAYNGTIIHVDGVETLLDERQLNKTREELFQPWLLPLERKRTRTYHITCRTDGLVASDLAFAISLLRTAQMEGPGTTRAVMHGTLDELQLLNRSDVAKAAYSVKAEDLSDSCTGAIDAYRTCGAFKKSFFIPFFAVSTFIICIWLAASLLVPRMDQALPVNIETWRALVMVDIGRLRSKSTDDAEGANQAYPKHSLETEDLVLMNCVESGARLRRISGSMVEKAPEAQTFRRINGSLLERLQDRDEKNVKDPEG